MKWKSSQRWNDIKWYGKELNEMETKLIKSNDIESEGLSVMERNGNEL